MTLDLLILAFLASESLKSGILEFGFRVILKNPRLVNNNYKFQKMGIISNRFQNVKAHFSPDVLLILRNILTILAQIFLISNSLIKILWTAVLVNFSSSQITLTVNHDLNAQETGLCRHVQRFLNIYAFLYYVHLQLTPLLLRMDNTTGKPQSLINTVSVRLARFCKSFRGTMPKSESKSVTHNYLKFLSLSFRTH